MTHSVADLVVRLLDEEHRKGQGTSLGRHERQIAKMAAAMALTLTEPGEDGKTKIQMMIEEAHAKLRRIPVELLGDHTRTGT